MHAVSEKKGFDKPKKVYKIALKICKEKLPGHPETAATLLFAGRYAKRRKENDEAVDMFRQALELLTTLLGDHFMTAHAREMEPPMKQQVLDKMEASMKEGLDMSYRLVGSRTIDRLGNKHLIRNFLNHYPERFPGEQYPRR